MAFDKKFCGGHHEHQRVEGSECGQKRSLLAQVYPGPMVDAIAHAVLLEGSRVPGF